MFATNGTLNKFSSLFWNNFDDFLSTTTGMIVALAWNNAITGKRNKNEPENDYYAWYYAIIVTVISLVMLSSWALWSSNK